MPTQLDDSFARAVIRLKLADENRVDECLKTVVDGDAPSLPDAMVERGLLDRPTADRVLRQSRAEQPRPLPDPSTAAEPPRIAGYEVLDKIGEGGMGTVWKARQTSLNRVVAIKVLPPLFSRDGKFIERFRREALETAKLNHPNIVSAIDVGVESREGHPDLQYFVMEYVDGDTLESVIIRAGRVKPDRAVEIAAAVAAALNHAWTEAKIVHRDIKPANILITRHGVVKLADLGLARSMRESAHLTTAGLAIGTPHYVSPEQAQGEEAVDVRSDIYALGATLFHMLTGRTPFQGETAHAVMARHVNEDAPFCHDVDPSVPREISAIVAKMMQRAPAERYQTAGELITEFERLRRGERPLAYTRLLDAYESGHGASGTRPPEILTPRALAAAQQRQQDRVRHWPHALGVGLFLAAVGVAVWYIAEVRAPADPAAHILRKGSGGDGQVPGPALYANTVELSLHLLNPNTVVGPGESLRVQLTSASQVRCLVKPAKRACVYLIAVYNDGPGGAVRLAALAPSGDGAARQFENRWNAFPVGGAAYDLPASASTVAFIVGASDEVVTPRRMAAELTRIAADLPRAARILPRLPAGQTLWYDGAVGTWGPGAPAVLGALCDRLGALFEAKGAAFSGAAVSYSAR